MGWYINTYLVIFVLSCLGVMQKGYSYPTPIDFSGELLQWSNVGDEHPILFEVIADDISIQTSAQGFVVSAAALWSNVPRSSLRMRAFDPAVEVAQISIEIVDQLNDAPEAAGYSFFDQMDGAKPKHCTIKVRSELLDYSYSFSKTILHELGHCIGLGHSLVPEAIMSYELEKNGFSLDTDDVAAVARLYPDSSRSAKLPQGCAVQHNSQKDMREILSLVFILIFPVFLILGKKAR